MIQPELIAETADYFVFNKPAGMAVEKPSSTLTLQDWLIEQRYVQTDDWPAESRVGVVHRLDTDTSGVIIWAKNPTAQAKLRLQWQGRQVKKTYLALVAGECEASGTIELAIERDNKNDRQKVALLPSPKSRPAITTYRRLAIGEWHNQKVSLLELCPTTGRTHQIRVHLKAIGHPIIGDKLYGEKVSGELSHAIGLKRQFLHAWKITLPGNGEAHYQAPLPADLTTALATVQLANPT